MVGAGWEAVRADDDLGIVLVVEHISAFFLERNHVLAGEFLKHAAACDNVEVGFSHEAAEFFVEVEAAEPVAFIGERVEFCAANVFYAEKVLDEALKLTLPVAASAVQAEHSMNWVVGVAEVGDDLEECLCKIGTDPTVEELRHDGGVVVGADTPGDGIDAEVFAGAGKGLFALEVEDLVFELYPVFWEIFWFVKSSFLSECFDHVVFVFDGRVADTVLSEAEGDDVEDFCFVGHFPAGFFFVPEPPEAILVVVDGLFFDEFSGGEEESLFVDESSGDVVVHRGAFFFLIFLEESL